MIKFLYENFKILNGFVKLDWLGNLKVIFKSIKGGIKVLFI